MKTLARKAETLSITFKAGFDPAFEYLANPMNQKEWAIHFIKNVEKTTDGYMATTPFAQLPIRIDADERTGVLDFYLGEGHPTRTRLIEIEDGTCTYTFTIAQPKEMPDTVWENEGLPNMKEEMEILKEKLERL